MFNGERDNESRTTLIVVNRYLRLMADKTIADSEEWASIYHIKV